MDLEVVVQGMDHDVGREDLEVGGWIMTWGGWILRWGVATWRSRWPWRRQVWKQDVFLWPQNDGLLGIS